MPTGYTSIIEDNPETVTFRQYALRCARGMGACILQRDEPLDNPPNVETCSDSYYSNRIIECESKLIELAAMTEAEKQESFNSECSRVVSENARYLLEHENKQSAYCRIRSEVVAYVPPTSDHKQYKEFMLEQIDMCFQSNNTPFQMSVPTSVNSYHKQRIIDVQKDLDNAKKDSTECNTRNKDRSEWIRKLYKSLPSE